MFRAPKAQYADYYEQSRFRLTWNLNMMLLVALGAISIVYIFVEPRFLLHYVIGTLLALSGILYMRIKKQYGPAAISLSFLAFGLVTSSFFLVRGAPHIIELFWLLNIVLYVYFTLGETWGKVFLAMEVVVAAIYFITGFEVNISEMPEFTLERALAMSGEFAICSFMLGYIIHQFIKSKDFAENRYRLINEALRSEKKVVELQNSEKTVLLQEIHHRVKNNLQVITSLLRIQSSQITSIEAQNSFQDAVNRIMTMALIHQKMYEGESLSEIDLKDYFHSLVEDIVSTGPNQCEVELDIEVNVGAIGQRSIVPLALILNELVTNSLKHGFSDRESGKISILLDTSEGKELLFHYSDNGNWKEPSFSGSLGIQLIEAFTEQLDGTYVFKRENDQSAYYFKLYV